MKAEYAKSLPDGWERFSRFFFALGDRTRQQIMLVLEPSEEICVNDIVRMFPLSRPAISHHLKVLRNAGLLSCEKRGKEVYYRVNYHHCADVLRVVHEFVTERAEVRAAELPRLRAPSEVSGPISWDRGDAPSDVNTTRGNAKSND
jgi:ArsR family transcriptional regulator